MKHQAGRRRPPPFGVCDVPKGHPEALPPNHRRERRMPIYHRTYSPGGLQFITTSTYRRAPVFLSPPFCHYFVERLEEVRQKMHCLLIGWLLMPEHFHLLLKPQPATGDAQRVFRPVCGGGLAQAVALYRL